MGSGEWAEEERGAVCRGRGKGGWGGVWGGKGQDGRPQEVPSGRCSRACPAQTWGQGPICPGDSKSTQLPRDASGL